MRHPDGPKQVRRRHPRGRAGGRLSIQEVARMVAEARLDPPVRAWAQEMIVRCGNPPADHDKAACLLDALRDSRAYIEDPIDSDWMPSAACTLAGCDGLIFLGEDCDGLLIAWLGACATVGLEVAVVGVGYDRTAGAEDHVIGAVYSRQKKQWARGDPSDNYAFGEAAPSMSELWIQIPNMRVMCDGSCDPSTLGSGMVAGQIRPEGDFVGVGGTMNTGQLGQVSGEYSSIDTPEDQALARSVAANNGAVLYSALISMAERHAEMLGWRQAAGVSPVDAPSEAAASKQWTADDEMAFQAYLGGGKLALGYLVDARNGKRALAFGASHDDVGVTGSDTETRISASGDGTITIEQPGSQPISVGVRGPLLVGIAIVCGAAVAAIIAYTGAPLWEKHIATAHEEFMARHEADMVSKLGPEKYSALRSSVAAAAKTEAAAQVSLEQAKKPEQVGNVMEKAAWFIGTLAVAGLVTWGVFTFGPRITKALDTPRPAPARAAA